nr:TPA_asm: hypothetical protein HUJ06_011795 [Nelumbo nucifera]
MEVSGVVFRSVPSLSSAGFDTQYLKASSSCLCVDAGSRSSGNLRIVGPRDPNVVIKTRTFSGNSSSGFSNNGHLQYYVPPRSGGDKKEKVKEKSSEIATRKKRSKLIKGLSKDLLKFSGMDFGLEVENGMVAEVKGKMFTEAAKALLAQLQQLRAKEKEMKRKRKQEKTKMKAAQMKSRVNRESSAGYSESIDSECEEIGDMSCLRNDTPETKLDEPEQEVGAVQTSPSEPIIQGDKDKIEDCSADICKRECHNGSDASCCSGSSVGVNDQSNLANGASTKRIEVCMGGKCKKLGAEMLLTEFKKRLGVEGAVVGCKCMGKCRDGANVRILNGLGVEGKDESVRGPSNHLFIGVGLKDVATIVESFFGEERDDFGLLTVS